MFQYHFLANTQKLMSFLLFVFLISACSQNSLPSNLKNSPETNTPLDDSITPIVKATATNVLPSAQIFSIDNAETVPPESIFEEVSYLTVGGGGGPSECPYYDLSSPTIGFSYSYVDPNNNDEPKPIEFSVCGWDIDEKVDVKITTPRGDVIRETIIASRPFYNENPNSSLTFAVIDYEYVPSIDQYGKYEFTFSGTSGFFKHVVYVQSPDLEMKFQPDGVGDFGYYIQGLYPDENVLFVIYRIVSPDEPEYDGNRDTFKFVGSNNFTSNSKGELLIKISDEPSSYYKVAAVGDVSGLIPYYDGLDGVERINFDGSCIDDARVYPPIVPTRLEVGDYAFIAFEPPQANILRNGPGKENKMINKIYPGDVVELINGPNCINGVNWWNVKGTNRDFEGWTSEGDGEYWLVPCSKKLNDACP